MKKTILALALIASTSAFADVKAGKFGMGFSYAGSWAAFTTTKNTGSSSGISQGMPTANAQYHITDMIAVAANVGFFTTNYRDKSSLDAQGFNGQIKEYSATAWSAGLEIPLYLAKFNLLNFYVAPGFSYTPYKVTTTTTNVSATGVQTTPANSPSTSTSNYLSIYGVIGLQVAINDQLHAFGRTTIGYASGTYNSGLQESTDSYFGLQSWAVGALFYFN